MDRDSARAEIDATLRDRGFKLVGGECPTYIGQISVHGQKVDVKIEIPDTHFVALPRIHLTHREQIEIEVLAHIEAENGICYASAAGLPLDAFQPGASILRILRETEITLERSFKGQGVQQVADEYQQYWDGIKVRSLIEPKPNGTVHESNLYIIENGEKKEFILSDNDKIRGWTKTAYHGFAKVYFTSGRIGPNTSRMRPNNFSDLENWWKSQKALAAFDWDEVVSSLYSKRICFVFAQNASVGFEIIIPKDIAAGTAGKRIRDKAVAGILRSRSSRLEISRWGILDSSLTRITTRNALVESNLARFKIALVGCGTIGSHLARMLAQSGAGQNEQFFLFDTDVVSSGNLGRHLLNFSDLGQEKAIALSQEVERFHPDVNVTPLVDDAVKRWPLLKQCDVVVDATGDWNVQNALNQLFLTDQGSRLVAMFHSWVVGNGVAAQSFLNLADSNACFRCLRPNFAGDWRYPAIQNGVTTELIPANCGDGAYAAFSVDAPITAAALTNRAILDWASGHPGARLRTNIVDMINGRYQQPKSPPPASNCPACSQSRT